LAIRVRLAAKIRQRYQPIHGRWRQYLHAVVFVPATAEPMLDKVKGEGPQALRSELERLSALGAPWASALLAYQALLLRDDGTRDIERAITLCKEPAARGDVFAQYILAWAFFLSHNRQDALVNLKKSVRQLFPRALLDAVRIYWRHTSPPKLLRSLMIASRAGHRATLLNRCRIYRSGKLGFFRRFLGYALAPVATFILVVAGLRNPFSAQVFAFNQKAKVEAISCWDWKQFEWVPL
jgi:hypothetical protein